MIRLEADNVLLKPSHRKQLATWLKRTIRFAQRLGYSALKISIHRYGKQYEVRADVSGKVGKLNFRSRRTDWQVAAKEMIHNLTTQLHDRVNGFPA
jgi:ribosome-associated translation inhibitor RaiA